MPNVVFSLDILDAYNNNVVNNYAIPILRITLRKVLSDKNANDDVLSCEKRRYWHDFKDEL